VLIAIISDTHLPRGTRALPAPCLTRLRAADLIMHAGDISTRAVLDELRAIGPPLHAVQPTRAGRRATAAGRAGIREELDPYSGA
jgi:predicted phosphodiesterase